MHFGRGLQRHQEPGSSDGGNEGGGNSARILCSDDGWVLHVTLHFCFGGLLVRSDFPSRQSSAHGLLKLGLQSQHEAWENMCCECSPAVLQLHEHFSNQHSQSPYGIHLDSSRLEALAARLPLHPKEEVLSTCRLSPCTSCSGSTTCASAETLQAQGLLLGPTRRGEESLLR